MKILRVLVAAASLTMFAGCASAGQTSGNFKLAAPEASASCSGLRPASNCYCRMARIRCQ